MKNGENEVIGKLKVNMRLDTPFTLYLPPPTIPDVSPDCVSIYIDHGEKIVQKQLIGKQLVFCLISYLFLLWDIFNLDNFLNVEYQTRELLSSNNDPEWKCRFVLPVNKEIDYEKDIINIELSTANIIGATSLGLGLINLKKYVDGNLYDEVIEIRDKYFIIY